MTESLVEIVSKSIEEDKEPEEIKKDIVSKSFKKGERLRTELMYYFLEPGVTVYIGGQVSGYTVRNIHNDYVECLMNRFYIGEINKIQLPIKNEPSLVVECEYVGPKGYNQERDREIKNFLERNSTYQ